MFIYPQTARDWIAATRCGSFSVREGLDHIFREISERNAELNAFERLLRDESFAAARKLDARPKHERGPLHGLPVAVKAELPIAGIPTSYGTAAVSRPAPEDGEVVRRLRAAGAVIVGTTAMPEFGQWPTTSSMAHGVTRNPLNLDYSPGGSSGGTAAAVAAGLVPVAIGSDGGGSIRIPASYTGLVGLKPTRGRVGSAPYPDVWGELGTTGPLARTPDDAALIYSVISPTFEELDPTLPARPRFLAMIKPPRPLVRVHRDNQRAVRDVVRTLSRIGKVSWSQRRLPDPTASFVVHYWSEVSQEADTIDHPRRLEARTRTNARLGKWVRRVRLARPCAAFTARIDEIFAEYDYLVTPVTACRPPRAEFMTGKGALASQIASMPAVAFTALANVSGHPAISIPVGKDEDGLPLAVQIVGRWGSEKQLLALARVVMRTDARG